MDDFERWQQQGSIAAAPEAAPASNSIDLFGMLRRRLWIIIVGLIIGLFVGYVIYLNSSPVFQSFARLTVSRRGGYDSSGRQGNPVEYQPVRKGDLELEVVRLRAPVTLYQAILSQHLDELDSYREWKGKPQEVLEELMDQVSVSMGDPNFEEAPVLNLSYRGPLARDCPVIINAIIGSYKAQLADTYESSSTEVQQLFKSMFDDSTKKVETLQKSYVEIQNQLPGSLDLKTATTAADTYRQLKLRQEEAELRVDELRRLISMARQKEAEGESRIAILNWLISEQPTVEWADLAAPAEVQGRQVVNETLLDLQAQKTALLETWAANHPMVKAIDARIEAYQEAFPTPGVGEAGSEESDLAKRGAIGIVTGEAMVRDATGYKRLYRDSLLTGSFFENHYLDPVVLQEASAAIPNQAAGPGDFLEQRLTALNISLQAAQYRAAEITAKRQLEEAKSGELSQAMTALRFIDDELRSALRSREEALDKLSEIEVMPKTGYQVKEITTAGLGFQTAPSVALNLVLGGLVGGLLGLGIAFLVDLGDRSFRSPDEIRRTLGLPVVGHVPVFFPREHDEEESELELPSVAIDKMICTYNDPDSLAAEAYRAVRTSLYFSTHGESHKVIQITSPSTDDGKSTLAANLAVSLAQSGVKVLLVDADFRRPKVHSNFGIDKEAGLSNLIRGAIDLPDAIHSSEVENLDLMPAGPRPRNPSELLTLPRFKELLATLRDRYDFVLIDTPPILAVTDPAAIAARVDGVLLALQIRRKVRPSATRAVEILAELGANVLGVVVNGVGWKRSYTYREGGNFGSGSRFYKYSADFRGAYLLGDAYAYSNAAIEPSRNGELLDSEGDQEDADHDHQRHSRTEGQTQDPTENLFQ